MALAADQLPLFTDTCHQGQAPRRRGLAHPIDPLIRVQQAASNKQTAAVTFDSAVASARRAGYSWRAIAGAAGVPHQSLHRRSVRKSLMSY